MTEETSRTGNKSSAELAAAGWERRFSYDEPRLSEAVEMYRELGFEVYLKDVVIGEEPGCSECMAQAPEKYKTIYTRKLS